MLGERSMTVANWLKQLAQLLRPPPADPARQLQRIKSVERDVLLPVRAGIVLVLAYAVIFPRWSYGITQMQEVTVALVQKYIGAYAAVNLVVAWVLLNMRRFSLAALQWVLWISGLLDALLVAALVLITTGFESLLYWVFPVLILRNAVSLPLAQQQLSLNVTVVVLYLVAGVSNVTLIKADQLALQVDAAYLEARQQPLGAQTNRPLQVNIKGRPLGVTTNLGVAPHADAHLRQTMGLPPPEYQAEPYILRMLVLFLITLICYGLQILWEKQRIAEEEARELVARQSQIDAAGRLSGEIAHQLKNPLGIINNAAYNLQRLLTSEKEVVKGQITMIREEIERVDRIITELMGFAKLADVRVERLDVIEEIERALKQVFPLEAGFQVEIKRDYPAQSVTVVMQRGQLAEIFVNLMQNAREAMNGQGQLAIKVDIRGDGEVEITFADSGPGIPREQQEQVFGAYYSTKPKGTGLGLAIVRNTLEVYGGRIRVDSELGNGARFIINLPPKALGKQPK